MEFEEVKTYINKNVVGEELKNVTLFTVDYIFDNNPGEELNDIEKFCAYVKEKWEYSIEAKKEDPEYRKLIKSLLDDGLVPLSHYCRVNIEDVPFYTVYEGCTIAEQLNLFINAFINPVFNCNTNFKSYVENSDKEDSFNKWVKFGSMCDDKKRIKNFIEKINKAFLEEGEDINKWK